MKKRLMALSLATVMGLTLLAGCAKTESGTNDSGEVQQKIVHNLAANPQTIDPGLNESVDGSQVISTTFEGLCRTDENERAKPGIAESWEISDDGLIYTFKLRDAKWSDGEPVTAEDFKYSWQRLLDPATAAPYAYQMYYVKNAAAINRGEMDTSELGVNVVDDKTLEVTLESATPYFLELLAFRCYFPVRKDVVEADPEGWALKPETYISNGPFKVTEWTPNDVIVLEKNENYYDADSIKLEIIEYVMIVEASTAFAAFGAGEIDYTEQPPAEQIVKMQKEGDPNFQIAPYIGTYFYCFNMNNEVVKDVRVRRALGLAIDRQDIVDNVTKGGQVPATNGYCAPGLALSTGEDFSTVYGTTEFQAKADIEGAKAALAEAGYPDGVGFPQLELLYNTNESHKAIAEAIQEMWKKNLGIDVILRNEEWAVFQTSRKEGSFQVARHGWIGDYPDPMTFLDMWISASGSNDAKYNSPEYDRLIEASKASSGPERDKYLIDAQKELMKDLPIVPIYYYTNPIMLRTTIKGAFKSSLGPMIYNDAYVEAAE